MIPFDRDISTVKKPKSQAKGQQQQIKKSQGDNGIESLRVKPVISNQLSLTPPSIPASSLSSSTQMPSQLTASGAVTAAVTGTGIQITNVKQQQQNQGIQKNVEDMIINNNSINSNSDSDDIMDRVKQERAKREMLRQQNAFVIKIQRTIRGYLTRRRYKMNQEASFDSHMADANKFIPVLKISGIPPKTIRLLISEYLSISFSIKAKKSKEIKIMVIESEMNASRLRRLCDLLSQTAFISPENSSIAKIDDASGWLFRMKRFVLHCVSNLSKPGYPSHDILQKMTHCPMKLTLSNTQSESLAIWTSHLVLIPLMNDLVEKANAIDKSLSNSKEAVKLWTFLTEIINIAIDDIEATHKDSASLRMKIFETLITSPGLVDKLPSSIIQSAFKSCFGKDSQVFLSQFIKHLPDVYKSSNLFPPTSVTILGNLISSLQSEILTVDTQELELLRILLGDIPIEIYQGDTPIIWHKTGNVNKAVSIPATLSNQLSMMTSKKLICHIFAHQIWFVDDKDYEMKRIESKKEWEINVEPEIRKIASVVPSTQRASRKGIVATFKELWSTSSWAKRLGFSSSSSSTDIGSNLLASSSSSSSSSTSDADNLTDTEEEEDEDVNKRSKVSQSTRKITSSNKKLHPGLLSGILALYFYRWPPTHTHPKSLSLLNILAFSFPTVSRTWHIIANMDNIYHFKRDIDSTGCNITLQNMSITMLLIFSMVFAHLLLIMDDDEIYDKETLLTRLQIEHVIQSVRAILFTSITKFGVHAASVSGFQDFFNQRLSTLLWELYNRHSRRILTRMDTWIDPRVNFKDGLLNLRGVNDDVREDILDKIPFCMPFAERAALFQKQISQDRSVLQPSNHPPKHRIQIRRQAIFEDGYRQMSSTLSNNGKLWKERIYITFINDAGASEAGIDAGGLFKEFFTNLASIVFNPSYGLFKLTNDQQFLYPNPDAAFALGVSESECLKIFEFVGLVLGKALYEEITVQPSFAPFFLCKMLGRYNFFHELQSLDAELYKNLLFLKHYDGDIRELSLNFTISVNKLMASASASTASTVEVDLLPGGSKMNVTSANKFSYINLMGNYRLNVEGKNETDAFLRGFFSIISPRLLKIFSPPELQTLISGSQGGFDLDDLKKNCQLEGGFYPGDRTLSRFWDVVSEFNDVQKGMLLKFVTSCERPPILGFSSMTPPFTIRKVVVYADDKLPTASTCFNTLKLPTYSSSKVMKEKLLFAISSSTGFEMS